MKTFDDLADIKSQFTKGKLKSLPDEISIGDINYKLLNSTSQDFEDIINNNNKPMIVYSLDRNKENKERYDKEHGNADDSNFQDRLVFIWAQTRLNVRPMEVKFVSKGRMGMVMVQETNDQNVIGDVVEVRFTSMSQSITIKGKVDTGATMSSMHAEKININDKTSMVSFFSDMISPNIITLPLQDKQSIKSADGGTEYRPVIAVNVSINGKPLPNVLINLNDRSKMEHKLLVGQNILEQGKFLIDPSIQEDEGTIDWDMLQDEFKDLTINEEFGELSDEHLIEELRIRINK